VGSAERQINMHAYNQTNTHFSGKKFKKLGTCPQPAVEHLPGLKIEIT